MPTAYDLLTRVEGVGEERANTLLNHFDSGSNVAIAASHGWGEIAQLDGFSEESAQDLFHRMIDADVYDQLKRTRVIEAGRDATGQESSR